MVATDAVNLVDDCEQALAAHWTRLGRLPGCRMHGEDGLVWFETPVRHLPYNGVVRTRLSDGAAAVAAADRLARHFRARGADFWWVVHPTAEPSGLGRHLEAAGLHAVERMNFMSLELDGCQPQPALPGVVFKVAEDRDAVHTYSELTYAYWEIPPEEQDTVARLHRAIVDGGFAGDPYLAYRDGKAVAKAYLSFPGPPGVASLYGMSVLPEVRGQGIAAGLTGVMMARAKERGCHRAVLHATDMAVGVYRRVGFTACGTATVFATAPLWSD